MGLSILYIFLLTSKIFLISTKSLRTIIHNTEEAKEVKRRPVFLGSQFDIHGPILSA